MDAKAKTAVVINLIPLRAHPSNLDKAAKLVSSGREADWSVYQVKGGFLLSIPLLRDGFWSAVAVETLFQTDREAIQAAPAALALARSEG